MFLLYFHLYYLFLGIGAALFTFLIILVRFCWEKYHVQQSGWALTHLSKFIDFFITAITILVVAVPEGNDKHDVRIQMHSVYYP